MKGRAPPPSTDEAIDYFGVPGNDTVVKYDTHHTLSTYVQLSTAMHVHVHAIFR